LKIFFAFSFNKSPLSCPLLLGFAPNNIAYSEFSKASKGSEVDIIFFN